MTLAEFTFIKVTTSWRFWAFGYHTYRRTAAYRSRPIYCIGLGPWRLHFMDTRQKTWRFVDETRQRRYKQRGK
jgi:hypothetical protein